MVRSAKETRVSLVDDLDPGIKTLSSCLFKILLRLENDLVDASGDLELGYLPRPFGVARREQCHAATVLVSDTEERGSTVGLERERKWTEPVRDGIKHAEITPVAIDLENDLDTLGGLSQRGIEDCHCQRARSTMAATS